MPRRLQPDRSARRPPSTCFCVEGASHPKNPVGGLRLKAAVHHLTRALAQRMAAQNVTVNSIAPGPSPSRMMATTLEEHGDEFRGELPAGSSRRARHGRDRGLPRVPGGRLRLRPDHCGRRRVLHSSLAATADSPGLTRRRGSPRSSGQPSRRCRTRTDDRHLPRYGAWRSG